MKVSIKRALVSVSDKTGVVDLCKELEKRNVEIISTGGTYKVLKEAGISVLKIDEYTGDPEIFDGRIKTLGRKLSGALLMRRDHDGDKKEALSEKIMPIDLVVVNLYPFEEAFKKGLEDFELCEFIDIGGPTMLRSSAKNYKFVSVLTRPDQYPEFLQMFRTDASTELGARKSWAKDAFLMTADYDRHISNALMKELEKSQSEETNAPFPIRGLYQEKLRYGENPHQKAFICYQDKDESRPFKVLQGKAMSYNNFVDAHAAIECVLTGHFSKHKVAVIKHANPAGMAWGEDQFDCLKSAWKGDPVSAFGGIVAFNQEVGVECVEFLSEYFIEVVCAPAFSKEALAIFSKKKNVRLVAFNDTFWKNEKYEIKRLPGCNLIQEKDPVVESEYVWVTKQKPQVIDRTLYYFGECAGRMLKSNAIALVKKNEKGTFHMVGAGMGNPNRLVSFTQARDKARENGILNLNDVLMVSDAFFPFDDIVKLAHADGIQWVIQPGGSMRDEEVIKACDDFNIGMAFTNTRHFYH